MSRSHSSRNGREKSLSEELGELDDCCRNLQSEKDDLQDEIKRLNGEISQMKLQCRTAEVRGEFRAVAREISDASELARLTLEYLQEQVGVSNSAFYSTSGGIAKLITFINPEYPIDSFRILLDLIKDPLCEKISKQREIRTFQKFDSLTRWLSIGRTGFKGNRAVAFPCIHDGDCEAVMIFFREEPFTAEELATFEVVREILASELVTINLIDRRMSWPAEPDSVFDEEADRFSAEEE